jgi:acetylornithine/succinyldiaminopimelate/putrescine aminotransferase
LIGLELAFPCKEIVEKARDKGVLLNCIQDNVLRFAPPLIIEKEQIDKVLSVLDSIFSGVSHG